MICAQPITHTIKAGDSLWLIAQAYNTTVDEIMTMNPGIDPYNLQIGTQIYVCSYLMSPADEAGMNHLRGETEYPMPDEAVNGSPGQNPAFPEEEVPPTRIAPLPPMEELPEADGGVWTQPVPERYIPENMLPDAPEWSAGMMGGSGMTGENGAMGGADLPGDIGSMGATATQSLNNRMHKVWCQHLYWMRMMMVSILGHLEDQRQVTARALQSSEDIMAVFAVFYPASDTRQAGQLLTNHVQDEASLVTALRDGNKKRAEELNRHLYEDSSQLANALCDLNPYYNRKQLKEMLSKNIDRGNRQTVNRLAGNYTRDVQEFDKAKEEMMEMADYLTEGIFQQFYS